MDSSFRWNDEQWEDAGDPAPEDHWSPTRRWEDGADPAPEDPRIGDTNRREKSAHATDKPFAVRYRTADLSRPDHERKGRTLPIGANKQSHYRLKNKTVIPAKPGISSPNPLLEIAHVRLMPAHPHCVGASGANKIRMDSSFRWNDEQWEDAGDPAPKDPRIGMGLRGRPGAGRPANRRHDSRRASAHAREKPFAVRYRTRRPQSTRPQTPDACGRFGAGASTACTLGSMKTVRGQVSDRPRQTVNHGDAHTAEQNPHVS
jgi:hypothetical protein